MCVTDAPSITNHEPDPCSPPHTVPSHEVQDITQTRIFSIENTCTQDPLANATNKFDSEGAEQDSDSQNRNRSKKAQETQHMAA